MADDNQNPAPEPTTPVPATAEEPEWVIALRQSIEALPGKLKASVTEDDRRSIAETVHGLFEQSGAFLAGEEPPKPKEEQEPTKPETVTEEPPKKASGLSRFASWFQGEA